MLRRLARTYGDIGGRDTGNPLLKMSAAAKIAEGSAISSADDAMDSAPLAQRQRQGALEQQKRSVLQPASLAPAGPAATLATARPPATGASLSPEAQRTSRKKFYADQQASRTGLAAARPPAAGATPPVDKPEGSSGIPILGDVLSTAKKGIASSDASLKDARVKWGFDEPGSMADRRLRQSGIESENDLGRARIIAKAREESKGDTSVTRGDVIDRFNKEREAKGLEKLDITGAELADIDSNEAANAPKSEEDTLADVRSSRSEGLVPLGGTPPDLGSARPVSTPTPVTPASAVTTAPVGVAPSPTTPSDPSKKTKGPSITTPQAIQDRADAALSEYRKKKKAEYDEVWNSAPNLPLLGEALGPQSGANKAYKSVRTFLSGKSY